MEEAQYEIDLGNLMAFDQHHQFASPSASREEIVKETIEQATKLVQAVADALFSLPSTEDPDGPLVKLPEPTTKLPREKPVCRDPRWGRAYESFGEDPQIVKTMTSMVTGLQGQPPQGHPRGYPFVAGR